MDEIFKLVKITDSKLNFSQEFLEITRKIFDLSKIENFDEEENFDEIVYLIEKRENIIFEIDKLDSEFLENFTKAKEQENFEEKIKSYKELSMYIEKIKENFRLSFEMDGQISPLLTKESDILREKIKNSKEKTMFNDKYSQDNMQKLTKENFGIFIDEMK